MIYHIILYDFPSGKTLLNIHIEPPVIKEEKIDIIGAFFTAITHFALQLFENNTELMDYIQFLNYSIRFVSIKEIYCDMLIVYDENEKLNINNISNHLIKIILKHKKLFINQRKDCNISVLTPVINPVLACITKINSIIA